MSMDTKDTLAQTYSDTTNFVGSKLVEGREPLEIAASLVALGVAIYKTTLADDEYNTVMDAISTSRGLVQALQVGPQTLQ